MQQYREMGTYFYHNRSCTTLWGGATRAIEAEGCLEDRAPGSQVVVQRWHMRGMLPLFTQSLSPAPTRTELFLPSSKKSQTKRRSSTTVTNEGPWPTPSNQTMPPPSNQKGIWSFGEVWMALVEESFLNRYGGTAHPLGTLA